MPSGRRLFGLEAIAPWSAVRGAGVRGLSVPGVTGAGPRLRGEGAAAGAQDAVPGMWNWKFSSESPVL